MPHPAIHLTVPVFDRVAAVLASTSSAAVAVAPATSVPGDLPGWANGGIVGVFIFALFLAVKVLYKSGQDKDAAMLAAKDEMLLAKDKLIEVLEADRDTHRAESEKNRAESQKLRLELQLLRQQMEGQE